MLILFVLARACAVDTIHAQAQTMTGDSMQWVRSALIFLILAVTVIPVASILVIASFVAPYRVTYFWIGRPWLQFSIATIRWVGGVNCRLAGYQNLLDAAAGNRVIICSKHQSTFETFFFPSIMTNPIAYVYKKELNLVPFFGWAIGRLHMVPIDRSAKGDAWQRVARIGARLMDQGKWIIMFPEATRAPRGEQLLYKSGAARLALETGAVIVPVAAATGRCWPRASWTFIPGTVDVSVGPALHAMKDESAVDFMARVEAWIETEMRIIDAEAYVS